MAQDPLARIQTFPAGGGYGRTCDTRGTGQRRKQRNRVQKVKACLGFGFFRGGSGAGAGKAGPFPVLLLETPFERDVSVILF